MRSRACRSADLDESDDSDAERNDFGAWSPVPRKGGSAATRLQQQQRDIRLGLGPQVGGAGADVCRTVCTGSRVCVCVCEGFGCAHGSLCTVCTGSRVCLYRFGCTQGSLWTPIGVEVGACGSMRGEGGDAAQACTQCGLTMKLWCGQLCPCLTMKLCPCLTMKLWCGQLCPWACSNPPVAGLKKLTHCLIFCQLLWHAYTQMLRHTNTHTALACRCGAPRCGAPIHGPTRLASGKAAPPDMSPQQAVVEGVERRAGRQAGCRRGDAGRAWEAGDAWRKLHWSCTPGALLQRPQRLLLALPL